MWKRFFSPPDHQSYFLFGPRGTGKSTWLKSHYKDAYWVDLLGGRALLRSMSPFYAKELGSFFHLEKNLRFGMLPIVLDSKTPEEILKAYTGIYLKEEVQSEGIVRHVGDFARFLEIMSFSHASLLNTSNISRECQIARKTVESYLINLVAQHLKSWIQDYKEPHQLHFWKTNTQLEVDFILSGPTCFYAIEVKNGTIIHPQDFRSLEAFLEDYPEATAILLYRGKKRYKERNILCLPVEEFLAQIDPTLPIHFHCTKSRL